MDRADREGVKETETVEIKHKTVTEEKNKSPVTVNETFEVPAEIADLVLKLLGRDDPVAVGSLAGDAAPPSRLDNIAQFVLELYHEHLQGELKANMKELRTKLGLGPGWP